MLFIYGAIAFYAKNASAQNVHLESELNLTGKEKNKSRSRNGAGMF